MSSPDSITLSTTDHASLLMRLNLLQTTGNKHHTRAQRLREELKHAFVLPPNMIPSTVVRVGSTFTVRDLHTEERDTFTLAWPEAADISAGKLSVLTPLGMAVIGSRVNDRIAWEMPGGIRHLWLESVSYSTSPQPAAAGFANGSVSWSR
ncbi:GreA/GreB family elongation factor [Synoicihabitans lomoniglobus]|uniref:GreA/GreB family elongation factor n=1 Tax=Synoicihabitans lomoniglobus TaxID=2909285 RepID=A0AAE9ZZI6_9BACT|nr:GreA/GreB family elongation factor [Opitutaceae bacterium LMO-M01]WED63457.1 GreA/GreB family elongation factor [Opitutaceae bacterium LMO-M01]